VTNINTQNPAMAGLLYQANAKSTGVAFLLWLFLGGFGGHRFYAGKTGTAIVQLLMSIFGWATVWVGIGLVLLAPLGIWLLIDAFLIPGMIRQHNNALVQQVLS